MSTLRTALTTLAQAANIDAKKGSEATRTLILLLGIIIVLFGIVMVVVIVYRSRVLKEETTPRGEGLTLSEIRWMRSTGDIDEEEFNRLKQIVTSQVMHEMDATPESEEGTT